jgi:streptogramin lyase
VKALALGLLLLSSTVHVSVAGTPGAAVARSPWTLRLSVRPASFAGAVRVTATGPRKIEARAIGGHGSYRAQLVFPSAGSWKLTARAGGSTSQLGVFQVRPAPPRPVAFIEPTSIDVEPSGSLLLVENNPGRLLRVNPATGAVTVLVPSLSRPYSAVRAPSGAIFFSTESQIDRLTGSGPQLKVAEADSQIGPVAVAPNGDVFFATSARVFRLPGGAGPAVPVAAGFSNPHGVAVAADGALLVSDTGNDRIRRIDPTSGTVTTVAQVGQADGLDVAADGSIYVVEGISHRIVRLSPTGARLGFVGPAFVLPYDVQAAPGGGVYVLEAGPTGYVRRVAPNGSVTTVSRS